MRGGLRLNISPEQGDEYKLVWGCSSGELTPYSVSGERVRVASERVRSVLNLFSNLYRVSDIADEQFEYSTLLPQLAFAGESLCESLFTPTSGNKQSATEARTFIARSNEGPIPLTINVSGTPLHVPWGFVFRGDATELRPAKQKREDFADFWTNHFNVAISFSRTGLLLKKPKQDRFYLMHALHAKHFEAAKSDLPAEVQQFIDQIIKTELGNFTDWVSCRMKWRKSQEDETIRVNQDANSIIYIFGHSDGTRICLSDDTSNNAYVMDSNDFSASFKKNPNSDSNTICFINGCRSGAGFLGNGFITATAMHGFQGFIGSEAELSSTFAARYGAEFMRRMCLDGYSVEEALIDLRSRDDLFPLSLLYSCYAEPEFRVR